MQADREEALKKKLSEIFGFAIAVLAFSLVSALVVYAVGKWFPINLGGFNDLVKVDKTGIGVNFLGLSALVLSLVAAGEFHRSRGPMKVRWVAILTALAVALVLLRALAHVEGGNEDVPGDAQFMALLITFGGFWVGLWRIQGQLGRQMVLIFFLMTVLYWCLDLSAIPATVAQGDPSTVFAGNGFGDSDFVYPLGSALGFFAAKQVGDYATGWFAKRFTGRPQHSSTQHQGKVAGP